MGREEGELHLGKTSRGASSLNVPLESKLDGVKMKCSRQKTVLINGDSEALALSR